MSGYRYIPLEEADAIRLLLLNPSADPTAPLSGSLLNTTILECDADFAKEYLALSYVWGNPTRKSFIQLDGIDVEITASLAEALQHLRNMCSEGAQRVWADALCINQSDVQEKNRQVPLMGNIFAHARSTIIYLGPLTANLKIILEAARSCLERVAYTGTKGNTHIIPPREFKEICGADVRVGEPPVPTAIKELIELPWFTRVWVFQELVLSRDPWVQCGSLRVRWRVLCALVIPILDDLGGPDGTALQQMHSAYLHPEGKTLCEILRSRKGCRATDPRDMIFAYMGMHSDREKVAEFVSVDYDISLKQLLISTARYIYSYRRSSLAFLLESIKRPANSAWIDLPSWVPDWGISEWPEPNPLRRPSWCGRKQNCIPGQTEQLYVLPHIGDNWPEKRERIQYLSPILPVPGEFPPRLLRLLEEAKVRFGRNRLSESQLSKDENLKFIQNLEFSSTKGGPLRKVFPVEFWATNLAPISAGRQLSSLLKAYASSDGIFRNRSWDLKSMRNVRLAATYGGFVFAVPGHIAVGDLLVSHVIFTCILRQATCDKGNTPKGLFAMIWHGIAFEENEGYSDNFLRRHPKSYPGPITLC